MDFCLTPEQRELQDSIRRFAANELDRLSVEADEGGEFSREAWRKCARMGLLGLPVPEPYGGAGADTLTTALALEALAWGNDDQGLQFSLNAQMWAVQHPLICFGTEEQKQRYLPRLCDGEIIGAHAMSEPSSGSDAYALRTTCRRTDTGYVLNGSKTFVTNAPVADLFVVFATLDPDRGFGGLCGFLIERDTPGLEVGPPLKKMGLRTSPMGEVFFDGCEVPENALLGKRGRGMMIFNASMERERSLILSSSVGAMARALDETMAYVKEREQFGQPIGKFQAVANRIVDMRLRLDTSRLLLYRLAWMIDQGIPVGVDSALAKLHLSESYVDSSLDALQSYGGYGYMAEYGIERAVRDAVGSRLYSGTSDIQRNLAARLMGL